MTDKYDDDCTENGVVETLVHEYKHIEDFNDLFGVLIKAHEEGQQITKEQIPKSVVDFLKGTSYLTMTAKNTSSDSPEEKARLIRVAHLYMIFTETRAYLTARLHQGIYITEAWTDQQIIDTLYAAYLNRALPPDTVAQAFMAAKSSIDYNDYLQKTQSLR